MKTIRYIIIIVILGILVGSFITYRMFTKTHTPVAEQSIKYETTASGLFNEFIEDEKAANIKYGDAVISVTGRIYEVDLSNDLEPQVVLETDDISGYIRCGFEPVSLEDVKKLKEGEDVKFKGECKGLIAADGLDLITDKDVIVSYCIIIE